MKLTRPIMDVIRARISTRTYAETRIGPDKEATLNDHLSSLREGPFGTKTRLQLVMARESDAAALKGLGTYGVVKHPAGFLVGAMERHGRNLEDLGYVMEAAILLATDLGLGTCWLGGTFRKSRFEGAVRVGDHESVPAVVAVGYAAAKPRLLDAYFRRGAAADTRSPWEDLFFSGSFDRPLTRSTAGAYAEPIEMVRLGPSASNKQPWRILKVPEKAIFHFYLRRTKGYDRSRSRFFRMADLQRIDIGIAMCHFGLTAEELGLPGAWEIVDPQVSPLPADTEYMVSWRGR